MDWKQRAIEASLSADKASDEQREQACLKEEQMWIARRLPQFKEWLENYTGADCSPESLRYVLDGVTFELRDLGSFPAGTETPDGHAYSQATGWKSFHIEGTCPECGRLVLSPPIWDKTHFGRLLMQFRAGPHDCRLPEDGHG